MFADRIRPLCWTWVKWEVLWEDIFPLLQLLRGWEPFDLDKKYLIVRRDYKSLFTAVPDMMWYDDAVWTRPRRYLKLVNLDTCSFFSSLSGRLARCVVNTTSLLTLMRTLRRSEFGSPTMPSRYLNSETDSRPQKPSSAVYLVLFHDAKWKNRGGRNCEDNPTSWNLWCGDEISRNIDSAIWQKRVDIFSRAFIPVRRKELP